MDRIGGRKPSVITAAAGFAVVLVLLGVVIGRSIGLGNGDSTHTVAGSADSQQDQISVQAAGWVYDVPVHTPWYDGDGTEHFGSRPSCLPPTGGVRRVSVTWVAYRADGATQRQVVSVDCAQ
jgi:hypothetical protein